MSLEGNLKDFSLAEILQLIAVQQKSGMLTVIGRENTIFFFRDGNLVSVRDRRKKSRDPLQEYIARTGVLSKEDLLKAARIQVETKIDLADILVSEGFLDQARLERVLHDLIQDTAFRVLGEEENSSYKFIAGAEILQGIKSPITIKVDAILMESMRRMDEFPRHREALPDPNIVLGRTKKEPGEEKPEGREQAAWDALAENHTVSYLLTHLGIPHYEVYEGCHILIEKGLVEIVSRPAVVTSERRSDPQDVAEPSVTKKRGIHSLVVWTVSGVCILASVLIGYRSLRRHTIPSLVEVFEGRSPYERGSLGEARDIADVELAIEAYHAQVGSLPATLDDLTGRQLISPQTLVRIGRSGWRYHLTSEGRAYTLVRKS